MSNPLRTINQFKTIIKDTFVTLVNEYLNERISEIDSNTDDEIKSLRLNDLTKSQKHTLEMFRELSTNITFNNNRFDILKKVKSISNSIDIESKRYSRSLKDVGKALSSIQETYFDDRDAVIYDIIDDIDNAVYIKLFKGRSSPLLDEQKNDINQWFSERNRCRNEEYIEKVKRDYISQEINRFKENEVRRLTSDYTRKYLGIIVKFRKLSEAIESDRLSYIQSVNQYVENVIYSLSEKGFQNNDKITRFINLLAKEYGIKIDILTEGEGALVDDETIAKIITDCMAGTPDRNLLINTALTLNLYFDIEDISTQELCNMIGNNLGIRLVD